MMPQPVKHDLDVRMAALMELQATYTKATFANTFNPSDGLFSPGTPIEPIGGDDEPREFEYQPGYNLYIQPRAGEKYGSLPFPVLRALAKSSKEVRLNIEHIKRQIRGLRMEFYPTTTPIVEGGVAYSAVVDTDEIVELFMKPDGVYDFGAWMNMVIEELLVTDAVTIYPIYELGKLKRLRIIDGATIRPFLDYSGSIPQPPAPAYGQILYGRMSSHYRVNQLLYRPLNTKVYSPYGESPIEWIILAINTAIRHDLQRVGAFTEGNIPGAFMTVPESWTPEQISAYNDFINAMLSGDTNRINKVLFIPGGTGQNLYQFSQNDVDKIEVDKFLMQVACWAFGNDPSEFSLVPGEGLGGKGWTEAASMRQYQNMTKQIVAFLQNLFNEIVHVWMDIKNVDVHLIGSEPPQDQRLILQQDAQYLGTIYDATYIQDRLGIPHRNRPLPQATPAAPAKPVVDLAAFAPFMKRAMGADLSLWKERAARALKKGWEQAAFRSDVIPDEISAQIYNQLQKASTPAEIDAAFNVDYDPLEMLQKKSFSSHAEQRAAFANMKEDGTYDEAKAESVTDADVDEYWKSASMFGEPKYEDVYSARDFQATTKYKKEISYAGAVSNYKQTKNSYWSKQAQETKKQIIEHERTIEIMSRALKRIHEKSLKNAVSLGVDGLTKSFRDEWDGYGD